MQFVHVILLRLGVAFWLLTRSVQAQGQDAILVDPSTPGLIFTGDWENDGIEARTMQPGATVSYTFFGEKIEWWSSATPEQGMEQITIDFEGSEDGLQWQANAMGYQESPTPSIAWEFGLELGSYTVTLEKISPEDTVMSFWYFQYMVPGSLPDYEDIPGDPNVPAVSFNPFPMLPQSSYISDTSTTSRSTSTASRTTVGSELPSVVQSFSEAEITPSRSASESLAGDAISRELDDTPDTVTVTGESASIPTTVGPSSTTDSVEAGDSTAVTSEEESLLSATASASLAAAELNIDSNLGDTNANTNPSDGSPTINPSGTNRFNDDEAASASFTQREMGFAIAAALLAGILLMLLALCLWRRRKQLQTFLSSAQSSKASIMPRRHVFRQIPNASAVSIVPPPQARAPPLSTQHTATQPTTNNTRSELDLRNASSPSLLGPASTTSHPSASSMRSVNDDDDETGLALSHDGVAISPYGEGAPVSSARPLSRSRVLEFLPQGG